MVIENIIVAYGEARILESSTLRVEKTGVTAILGRNGTGKTSVFNAIFNLVSVKDLAVSFDGAVVPHPYLTEGLINYIPQKNSHPAWLTTTSAINAYGLTPAKFLKKYPVFQEYGNSKFKELSFGTVRLLVTLLALESNTRYTILDEPFSNVMPLHNDLIVDAIQQVKQRKGILLSDHQFRTVLSVNPKLYLITNNRIRLLEDKSDLITYGYLAEGAILD